MTLFYRNENVSFWGREAMTLQSRRVHKGRIMSEIYISPQSIILRAQNVKLQYPSRRFELFSSNKNEHFSFCSFSLSVYYRTN